MAKRLTDTNKYKKPFIRGLKGAYKLLWDYLYHDCDHAGIWIVDFEIAQLYLGYDVPVNRKDALLFFNEGEERIIEVDSGKKWFIRPFIEFQYGELNQNNRVHASIIQILNKIDKGLIRGLEGCKDKDKDKDMDKDMEVESVREETIETDFKEKKTYKLKIEILEWENISCPEYLKPSIEKWVKYKAQKGYEYVPMTIEQLALTLHRLSNGSKEESMRIVDYSISNGFSTVFQQKNKQSQIPITDATTKYARISK